ncbi:OLC1v1013902C1 [Oldenlandia corymbosa var. corymbosa]|uniref:OLC1v1013902C1 n=1 Tax=Oldenlandia corymbosa var. corymbosa TaxID=529605 RepID=A0AAV1DZJ1_OLDCO|nr:OLC1v1013902C1 [Oldenlandia corymbosa var. corymbosa]
METKMKKLKKLGAGAEDHYLRGSASFGRPSWLLFSIADLDERMKTLAINTTSDRGSNADSFATRAEDYYQKRPQLLALLQDLYNGYLLLADRYCQALVKNNQNHRRRRYSSPISPFSFNEHEQFYEEDLGSGDVVDSDDAVSSLSFQTPSPPGGLDADLIVADVVIKSLDYEIMANELSVVETKAAESSRKIELQKSLLEVLESERLILLNENAGLAYRVNSLVEENKGLAAESVYMKRKAADLARCVLKMREDHRVCMLSRKIEDLQGQVHGLETRNECYDQIDKHEEEKESKAKVVKKGKSATHEVTLEDCFHVHPDIPCFGCGSNAVVNMKKGCLPSHGSISGGKKGSKFWDRVKKFDIFMCVPNVNSNFC